MSKFLTSELHQPNFMLEKARGIHLWLFWIITSAQFYISIYCPCCQKRHPAFRNRHCIACGLPEFKGKTLPQAALPIASPRGRHAHLKAKPGLECATEKSHCKPWEGPGPMASLPQPAACVGEQCWHLFPAQAMKRTARAALQDTTVLGWEGKVSVKFSLQPVFSSIWKNYCNSSHLACIQMTNTLQRQ